MDSARAHVTSRLPTSSSSGDVIWGVVCKESEFEVFVIEGGGGCSIMFVLFWALSY